MGDFTDLFLKLKTAWLILPVLALSACNIINPAEPVPAYLHVEPFVFSTADISQGSADHKIEDVWVYIDDDLQGVYELPATFPVIANGYHTIKLRPGIYFNGVKASRFPYPFYSIYDTLINFMPGNEHVIAPSATYTAGLDFTNENFDSGGGIIFDTTSVSKAKMEVTNIPGEVYEGTGTGKAILDSAHSVMEIATGALFLPVLGSQRTFIEVNYRSTIPLVVGLIANGYTPDHVSIITLKPNTEWNKLYLEITNPAHALSEATSFQVFFYARIYDVNSTDTVYLDNFKVIHD